MSDPHPLLSYFMEAAEGRFPPAEGQVTVLPPLRGGLECSVAFTGHAVIATRLPEAEVLAGGPDGYGQSLRPDFLRHLAGPQGWIDVVNITLVARGTGTPRLPAREVNDDHPRIQYALDLRDDVRVYGDARGFITLAQGLAGRLELSISLTDPTSSGQGAGRSLLHDALTVVPVQAPVFAAVTPGNARSLRAFLAAGFRPIGSEAILRPAPSAQAPASPAGAGQCRRTAGVSSRPASSDTART